MEEFILIFNLYCVSGLGFNIRGGSDANYLRGHPGIFVTSIKPGGSADRDSRLKIGDRLLEVNYKTVLKLYQIRKTKVLRLDKQFSEPLFSVSFFFSEKTVIIMFRKMTLSHVCFTLDLCHQFLKATHKNSK